MLTQKVNKLHRFRRFFRWVNQRGLWFAVSAVAWSIKTRWLKYRISWEDRLGLYTYRKWVSENEPLHNDPIPIDGPQFVVLLLVGNSSPEAWQFSFQALVSQTYPRWKLCLVMNTYQTLSDAVDVVARDSRVTIVPAIDDAFECDYIYRVLNTISGEYFLKLNAGDCPAPNLFATVVACLHQNPGIDILYGDEDVLADDRKTRREPLFKPDWSPELMLSINYLSHAIFRSDLLKQVISSVASEEIQSYDDLVFHTTERTIHVWHILQVLFHCRVELDETIVKANLQRSVESHLYRCGLSDAKAFYTPKGYLQVTWPVSGKPVSIIIPTRDKLEYLQKCVASILALTNYPNYELILVDSGSQETQTRSYYASLSKAANIRVIDYGERGFNFSAALNLGSRYAQGEILLFLNNDTEVIEPGWLEELVRWAELPEVGVAGAKLLYSNGLIQHAGIIIGMEGHANHIFNGMTEDSTGPFGAVDWYRDYSAVTGACLAIREDVFTRIGGFDEAYQLVFSDVELCQRAIAHGYRVIYTPFARLLHHEGKSRFRYMPLSDLKLASRHFKKIIEEGDPAYNPNLSYEVHIPTLRRKSEVTRSQRLAEIMRYQ